MNSLSTIWPSTRSPATYEDYAKVDHKECNQHGAISVADAEQPNVPREGRFLSERLSLTDRCQRPFVVWCASLDS